MADSRAEPLVMMRNVKRAFGDFVAVDDVTLDVPAGTILGLIGPSGSGKTTIVRMLTGTLEPTSGTLRVLGEEPRRFRRKTRERLGYMPQLFVLYPDLTAQENVSFVASLFGMFWRRRRKRVREALELVDLWDVRDRRASDLSGGMQRRLELACALVHEPAVIFLDEPTAGIDPVLRTSIWKELQRLRDEGRTLIVTTQYVGEAENCEQVAMLEEGRLVALGNPLELRRQAMGGEIIELELERPTDARVLKSEVDGILRLTPIDARGKEMAGGAPAGRPIAAYTWHVVSEDAGEITPRLAEAITHHNWEVASMRELHPSFDEVFTKLLSNGHDDEGAAHPAASAAQGVKGHA